MKKIPDYKPPTEEQKLFQNFEYNTTVKKKHLTFWDETHNQKTNYQRKRAVSMLWNALIDADEFQEPSAHLKDIDYRKVSFNEKNF